jgi:selenocysteine-specific elongation factor
MAEDAAVPPTPPPPAPSGESARGGKLRTLNINVGVLGHVDSGKTSLTRAMSTIGSTASFDKHPQSKERGITLDLGFSSFTMDMPEHLKGEPYDQLQVTLVDCPGHASLIRTIIGGAQIIDLMILVVDVTKGIQTQTAECLVIGEITNDKMVVVLNKVDCLPAASSADKLEKMKARIRKTLSATKFADSPMVGVAARPGGGLLETALKETSLADDASPADVAAAAQVGPMGIDELLSILRSQITIPKRNPDGALLFAIDHCFPIKGQGTVLTGTVLSGSMKVGMEIDFPELKQQVNPASD